jgi:hypothetical protein
MQIVFNFIQYVFDPLPPYLNLFLIPLIALAVIFIGFSIFLRIKVKKEKNDKTFRRLFRVWPSKLETVAVTLAIYMLARYYRVAFISTRIILFLTVLAACYVIYRITKTYLVEYPVEKKRHIRQMEKNKYIPGKKHK